MRNIADVFKETRTAYPSRTPGHFGGVRVAHPLCFLSSVP